jgi:hypothetical protein
MPAACHPARLILRLRKQKEFQPNGMQTFIRMMPMFAMAATFLSAQSSTTETTAEIVAERVARLTKILTLSTAQQTQATAIFTTEVNVVTTIKTSLATARTALVTAVEANNTAGITTAATTIGTLTTQEEQAEGTAEAAFYVILTADQKTIYQQLLAGGLDAAGSHYPGGGHGH